MDTDKLIGSLRSLDMYLDAFEVDLEDADPDGALADTHAGLRAISDAIAADLSRLESGDIA